MAKHRDPLADLIAEYRHQSVEFGKRAEHEEWKALTADTYGPVLDKLCNGTPEPTGAEGVLAAMLLARDEPELLALEPINDACIRYLQRQQGQAELSSKGILP